MSDTIFWWGTVVGSGIFYLFTRNNERLNTFFTLLFLTTLFTLLKWVQS